MLGYITCCCHEAFSSFLNIRIQLYFPSDNGSQWCVNASKNEHSLVVVKNGTNQMRQMQLVIESLFIVLRQNHRLRRLIGRYLM
ncbi:hypothetical protein D3C71_1872350 [compost metagenome]